MGALYWAEPTSLGGVVAAPLRHGSTGSLDELVFFGVPLLVFVVVWLFTLREGKGGESDEPPAGDGGGPASPPET